MPPVLRIFLIVMAGATVGVVLGGIFGQWAGATAPDLFIDVYGRKVNGADPLNTARVLGACTGVFLGGGLAVFSLALSAFHQWLNRGATTR